MRVAFIAAVVFGIALTAPASARNYDCSKAGNASKAACKSSIKEVAKAKPTPKATKVSSTTVTKTTTQRSYDCSKAGNKSKTACRTAAAPAAPMIAKTTVSTARNYDCSKAGNANKATCKTDSAPISGKVQTTTTSASYDCTKFYNRLRAVCRNAGGAIKTTTSTTTAAPAPVSRSAVTHPRTTTIVARSANSDVAGATATCKDGTFSHSKVHTGACSRHGGVAKWL